MKRTLKQTITFETIIEVDDTIDQEQLRKNMTIAATTWAEKVREKAPVHHTKAVEGGYRVRIDEID